MNGEARSAAPLVQVSKLAWCVFSSVWLDASLCVLLSSAGRPLDDCARTPRSVPGLPAMDEMVARVDSGSRPLPLRMASQDRGHGVRRIRGFGGAHHWAATVLCLFAAHVPLQPVPLAKHVSGSPASTAPHRRGHNPRAWFGSLRRGWPELAGREGRGDGLEPEPLDPGPYVFCRDESQGARVCRPRIPPRGACERPLSRCKVAGMEVLPCRDVSRAMRRVVSSLRGTLPSPGACSVWHGCRHGGQGGSVSIPRCRLGRCRQRVTLPPSCRRGCREAAITVPMRCARRASLLGFWVAPSHEAIRCCFQAWLFVLR